MFELRLRLVSHRVPSRYVPCWVFGMRRLTYENKGQLQIGRSKRLGYEIEVNWF